MRFVMAAKNTASGKFEFAAFACRSRCLGKSRQAPIDAASKARAFFAGHTKKTVEEFSV